MAGSDPTFRILATVLFGAIGMGYWVYGKKQQRLMPMVAGVGLFILPYVVSALLPTVTLGLALVILPFVVDQ